MTIENLLFSFQGRIRRSHWWATRVAVSVIMLLLLFGWFAVQGALSARHDPLNLLLAGLAALIAFSLVLWVDLAVNVKRLHDLGWSGWLTLVSFVPLVGGLFNLICLGIVDGKSGPNQFGPSPKS